MNLEELRRVSTKRRNEWDPGERLTLLFYANELAGEVGEACNVVKNIVRENLGISGVRSTVDDLAEELADVVIVADILASMARVNLSKAIIAKFNSTSRARGFMTLLQEGKT
jgi:NTP pyrophosphatase (non-canonical NTP hydrolase)